MCASGVASAWCWSTAAAGWYPDIARDGDSEVTREVTATSGDVVAGCLQEGAATSVVTWRREFGPPVHRAVLMRRVCRRRRR